MVSGAAQGNNGDRKAALKPGVVRLEISIDWDQEG